MSFNFCDFKSNEERKISRERNKRMSKSFNVFQIVMSVKMKKKLLTVIEVQFLINFLNGFFATSNFGIFFSSHKLRKGSY